jgi:hypothetical protein
MLRLSEELSKSLSRLGRRMEWHWPRLLNCGNINRELTAIIMNNSAIGGRLFY